VGLLQQIRPSHGEVGSGRRAYWDRRGDKEIMQSHQQPHVLINAKTHHESLIFWFFCILFVFSYIGLIIVHLGRSFSSLICFPVILLGLFYLIIY